MSEWVKSPSPQPSPPAGGEGATLGVPPSLLHPFTLFEELHAPRIQHASDRSAGTRDPGQRYRYAERHALRHPRRDADTPVRSRTQDAFRYARACGSAYRTQCEMGGRNAGASVRLRTDLHRHHHQRAHGTLHATLDGTVRRAHHYRQRRFVRGLAGRVQGHRRHLSRGGGRRCCIGNYLDRAD